MTNKEFLEYSIVVISKLGFRKRIEKSKIDMAELI